ncbi:MAG: hypothetical protein DRP09_09605, partial [Candidatus Thorarchaeota archaeon]
MKERFKVFSDIKRLVKVRSMAGWLFMLTLSIVMAGIVWFWNPSGIQIELIGAFLGVFAALALGALLSSIMDYSNAKQFIRNLFNELRLQMDVVESKGFPPLSKHVWEMGKSTGSIMMLDSNLVVYLLVTYDSFDRYNYLCDRV